jgi:rubrerythrin
MNLEEILAQALQMEEDGRNFYLSGLERVANPLSKEVLKKLADEELIHMEKIQEGYNKIKNREAFTFEGWGGVRKSSREYFENVFTEAKKHMNELVPPQTGELDTIKMAMDLESKSHHFYVEKMKVVDNREVASFLDSWPQRSTATIISCSTPMNICPVLRSGIIGRKNPSLKGVDTPSWVRREPDEKGMVETPWKNIVFL